MKKYFAVFFILASLVTLTACRADKEEVEESIKTTEALFKDLPFKPEKVESDGRWHYMAIGGTVDIYFSSQDISQNPILKYSPSRQGNKIEFYELEFGERTAFQLFDSLADDSISRKMNKTIESLSPDFLAAYQQQIAFEGLTLEKVQMTVSHRVENTTDLKNQIELYNVYGAKKYTKEMLKEVILEHTDWQIFQWQFQFNTAQVLDRNSLTSDKAEKISDDSTEDRQLYYAPEIIKSYLDTAKLPPNSQVELNFINQPDGGKPITLVNKKPD